MSDFNELYQQIILDHSKNPRNFKVLEGADYQAKGHNPLCGDEIDIYLNIEDSKILDISFKGNGCAISQSSASLMTGLVKGKSVEEAKVMVEQFNKIVTGEEEADLEILGKLSVFSGVKNYPSRVKCASLAWHTLKKALEEKKAKG